MNIQSYLLVILFISWTMPLHAMQKNATGKKRVSKFDLDVTGGVAGDDGAYIYDNGDIAITMSDADRHSGNWLYFYTSDPTVAPDDPGNIYTYIGDGAPESQTRLRILSFKNDVLPLKNQPGYYYIKEASSSQYAKIIVAGVAGAVADHQVVLPRVPCRISCTVAPENMDAPVVYTFSGEGSVFVLNPQTGDYRNVQEKRYEGEASIEFYWDTPGRKRINIRNPIGESVSVELVVARLEMESFPVAMNMNDSDFNGQADALQGIMEVDDPDLRKIHLFLECPGENGWRYHLGENVPEVISFFEFLKAKGVTLKIQRTRNFQVWLSPSKQVPFLINRPDPNDPGENVYNAGNIGNGRNALPFNPGTGINSLNAFFNSIYVEGIGESPEEQDRFRLSLEFSDKTADIEGGHILSIHLKIIYAVDQNETGEFDAGSDINSIVNPAVILRKTPDEMAVPGDEVAKFRLADNVKQVFLQNNDHDLIEWSVTAKPAQSVPLNDGTTTSLGEPQGGMAEFYQARNTGYTVDLYGIRPGFISIGVKVKGALTNYLELTALVQPELFLPVCFQFFVAENPERIGEFINDIPELLALCNIFARQSGITLYLKDLSTLANTAESMENYRAPFFYDEGPFPPQLTSSLAFAQRPSYLLPLTRDTRDFMHLQITDGHKLFLRSLASAIFFEPDPASQNLRFFLRTSSPVVPASLTPVGGQIWAQPDIPDFLQRTLILNRAFIISGVPQWVARGNGHVCTHLISPITGVVNINFVEDLRDGESEGETSLLYANRIGLNQNRIALLQNEEGGYQQPRVDKTPSEVFPDRLLPFAGTNLSIRRLFYDKGERQHERRPVFESAQVILHEILHSLGLLHRAILADDPDGIVYKGVVPSTDVGDEDINGIPYNLSDLNDPEERKEFLEDEPHTPIWNNRNNIMTHFPDEESSYDVDLPQSIIIRQNLILRNNPD